MSTGLGPISMICTIGQSAASSIARDSAVWSIPVTISPAVARCLEIVDESGLDYQLHAMGTLVEGELEAVLDVLKQCMEVVAADCNRVTCTAKFDLRRGHSGRLQAKVASVERQLGRELKKTPGR